VGNIIESVVVLDIATLKMVRLSAEHCAFKYRDSVFKGTLRGRVIILGVNFKFSKLPVPVLEYADLNHKIKTQTLIPASKDIRKAVLEIRNSKLPDPDKLGNAGSFFKNPVVSIETVKKLLQNYPAMPSYEALEGKKKLSAGWLIEQAGWKGRRIGNVGIYEHQALVVVNYGNATGEEIIAFSRAVSDAVYEKFGVKIEPEVNIIGS
jgi:UDP-N-acetylmuramate dehydrogenase